MENPRRKPYPRLNLRRGRATAHMCRGHAREKETSACSAARIFGPDESSLFFSLLFYTFTRKTCGLVGSTVFSVSLFDSLQEGGNKDFDLKDKRMKPSSPYTEYWKTLNKKKKTHRSRDL